MPEPTNEDRADQAEAALEAFRKVYHDAPELDDEQLIGDLIANLLHLAARQGLHAARILTMAEIHFNEETDEEETDDDEGPAEDADRVEYPATTRCTCAECRDCNEIQGKEA